MGSLTKKDKEAYQVIWKEALPGLIEQNVRIQKKALNVIEEKIEQAELRSEYIAAIRADLQDSLDQCKTAESVVHICKCQNDDAGRKHKPGI